MRTLDKLIDDSLRDKYITCGDFEGYVTRFRVAAGGGIVVEILAGSGKVEYPVAGDLSKYQVLEPEESLSMLRGLDPAGLPIESLELKTRSYHALKQLGVRTVGDVRTITEKQLLRTKNCGTATVSDIKSVISPYGFNLKPETED